MNEINNQKIIKKELGVIIGERFGRYAKYIIQERAIPDARDGLKPVQRRILFAMHELGLKFNKSYKKSARIVGEVIGKYHPHGDSSVYEAMVRMSQSWKTNSQLVDMHGNNGSIDDDPPAAMRYTEVRMSKISQYLLKDIEFKTISFTNNFDDSEIEPSVLPAKFPNLLVNGARGIAAGYATEIPPHNLGEVITAIIYKIENPSATFKDLLKIVKGPDFPTGGIVQGKLGIIDAFSKGKGRVSIKAKVEILKNKLIVTEIPFGVNKANMVKKIAEIILNEQIGGIKEIRDETSREGLKVVIELLKDSDAETILKYLYKNTELQVFYNYNMVVIDNFQPKLASLIELIDIYIKHQKQIITKKTNFQLSNFLERQHIIKALVIIIDNLDLAIKLIRQATSKTTAKEKLITQFALDDKQAEAIVTLQLYRLSSTNIDEVKNEFSDINKKITILKSILKNESLIEKIIVKELINIKNDFATPRKSQIENEIDKRPINDLKLIKSEKVVVHFTLDNYFNKSLEQKYNEDQIIVKKNDIIMTELAIDNRLNLTMFTSLGNFINLPIHKINFFKKGKIGQHINELVKLSDREKIIRVFNFNDSNTNNNLCFITKQGQIKRTAISSFDYSKTNKLRRAIKIKDNDLLIDVILVEKNNNVIVVNSAGFCTNFPIKDVPIIGLNTSGIKSIKLKEDQSVVGIGCVSFGSLILLITNDGYYKKISMSEIKSSNRALRGNSIFKIGKNSNQKLIKAFEVNDFSHIKFQNENFEWKNFVNKINEIHSPEEKGVSFTKKTINNVIIERRNIN